MFCGKKNVYIRFVSRKCACIAVEDVVTALVNLFKTPCVNNRLLFTLNICFIRPSNSCI